MLIYEFKPSSAAVWLVGLSAFMHMIQGVRSMGSNGRAIPSTPNEVAERIEEPDLTLSLSLPQSAGIQSNSGQVNTNLQDAPSDGSGAQDVWLAIPQGNRVEALRELILNKKRFPSMKRTYETDEDFQVRVAAADKLFDRNQRCELKFLATLEAHCNGDEDKVVRLYLERVNSRRMRKKQSDHMRYIRSRDERLASHAQQTVEEESRVEQDATEEERRARIAYTLHRRNQAKSLAKNRIRKAQERGVEPEVIARRMKDWGLDSLGDARASGSIKTAVRRKLRLDPDNVFLKMEAERLGMHPEIQPTPSKAKKVREVSVVLQDAVAEPIVDEDSNQSDWDLNCSLPSL